MYLNQLFRKKLRDRADVREAARNELNRITEASLTNLKSNFKSPDDLEETIRKLEKQITTTPPNKTRLTGARKRVINMRVPEPVARGGGFRRAALIALATQPTGLAALSSQPLKNNSWRPNTAAKLKKQFRSNFTNNSRYFNFKRSKNNINDIFETSESKENMKKRYKNYTNNLMKEIVKKKENQAIKAA